MSVLVKKMKMPHACADCPLNHDKMLCSVTGTQWWSDRFVLLDFDEYNERLPDCPLVKLPKGEWLRMSDLSEKDDDRYKCSRCGNVIHYKNRMALYTFNSWCGRCGSDNSRHTTIIEADKWEEDVPTVIEVEGEG